MMFAELEFWPVTEVTPSGQWGSLSGPQQPSGQIMERKEWNGRGGGSRQKAMDTAQVRGGDGFDE